jgi:hypothetical protein
MISSTSNFQAALAAYQSGPIFIQVVIEGYYRVFTSQPDGVAGHYPWIVSVDDLDLTVQDLDGGADQRTGGVTVQDFSSPGFPNQITADFPNFTFEGQQIQIQVGFAGLAQADFCTVFTGFIDTVSSSNSNSEYYIQFSDVQTKLAAVVFQTADDGGYTSSTNIKTVTGHPLAILMSICQQLGVPCDTTKITAYMNGPFAGTIFTFYLTQAPAAADFIKAQLMKPLGGYMWINAAGEVEVNFFYPLSGPVAVGSFGPSTWLDIPEAGQTNMVNTVQVQFDLDDSTANDESTGSYLSSITENYAPSYLLYGDLSSELTINADGVRSAFQGFFIAALTAILIFMRYGFKSLTFDSESSGGSSPDSIWSTLLYEPGDIISVTHPQVPNRAAGVMGITNMLFEMLNKTINFTEGKLTYTMLDAAYLSQFGLYKITPMGEALYSADTVTNQDQYMYFCGANGEYTDGNQGNILG